MVTPVYEIVGIDGLRVSPHRGIVFLRDSQDPLLNASAVFEILGKKRSLMVRSRFDYWIDRNVCDDYFHGWPGDSQYKGCFVFKWKHNRQCHRLYGFLHHPYVNTRRAFQLCVLCTHATKNQWATDPAELAGALALSTDRLVHTALSMKFLDTGP